MVSLNAIAETQEYGCCHIQQVLIGNNVVCSLGRPEKIYQDN